MHRRLKSMPVFISVIFLAGCVALHRSPNTGTRSEKAEAYLEEFCSPAFAVGSYVRNAIKHVLMNVPEDVYLKVTDRQRPVIFTEVHPHGTARFANTADIIVPPGDVPAFRYGFTIIKLSTELEEAGSIEPVAGIIAHELAHKYLDHAIKGGVTCQTERETNALVKTWGFENEFKAASEMFGREKTGGPPSCQD